MKKQLTAILMLAFVAMAQLSFVQPADELKVDTAASEVKWTGYHLAKSYEHWGYVNLKSGSVMTEGNKIISGQFVIDMTSISDKDLEKAKDNAKLVNHLKSDDFFNTEKFPEAKLMIKSTSLKSGSTYSTVADLTIRGITKEIKFDIEMKSSNASAIEATASFKSKAH